MAPGLVDTASLGASATQSPKQVNGHSAAAFSLSDAERKQVDLVLRQFRCLIADLCEQYKGGHPGSAMGMAAIGVALWKYTMRYSPTNPNYFNRDRFVLSNGHTCLFQYAFLHLTGYSSMTLEQLKSYHSSRTDSICPGHPEIENEGIEVTTGPLGQGIANAVGLAMATKNLAATYNAPGHSVVDNMTYCMVGDACLQEGVALEAIQLAGHWKLDNLIVLYDNNQITCDGSVDLVNSAEDINAKMRACGWTVYDVYNGCYDVEGIVTALQTARDNNTEGRPSFINIRTVIGIGSKVAGDAKAHGAAYGAEDVASIKRNFGMDPEQSFVIDSAVYDFFKDCRTRGEAVEATWNQRVSNFATAFPERHAEFVSRVRGEFTADWRSLIPAKEQLPTTPTPSRKSAGLVCNPLAAGLNNMIVGTADLSPSVNMIWPNKVDFQHPDLRTTCGINGNYSGRYVHWGIREHAMAAVSNGLAAFNKGTFLPVTSSFFMFYLYAAPGIRMGALQQLQAIHVATHDSIGTGEDGPTHQPVELAALYRAMPNLLYIRPCDSEETAGAFTAALQARNTPTIVSLSRQALPQYPSHSSREGVEHGAYVFIEDDQADITLIGVGSEMKFAVEARDVLAKAPYNLRARIVSFPCQRLFAAQSSAYKRAVLKRRHVPAVVIEAYAANGWERYADAAYSMSSFGHSLPGADAYKYFGFDPEKIAAAAAAFVADVKANGIDSLRDEFRDLNVAQH